MQRNEPLGYIIYSQLQKLIMTLMSNIIKKKVESESEKEIFELNSKVFDDNIIEKVLNDSTKGLELADIQCGVNTKKAIESLPIKDQPHVIIEMRKFYKIAITHINKNICNRSFLKSLKCIAPDNIKKSESLNYIVEISNTLPLYDIDTDLLTCEWKLLQMDEDVVFSLKEKERIDSYWDKIFNLNFENNPRYPTITRVIKAALALPHGSADVERGFSASALHLSEDRANMSERTLNARMIINDAMKKYDNLAHKVPITKQLLKLGQSAYRSYQMYLEEQKKAETEKHRLETLKAEEKEKELMILNKLKTEMKDIDSLKEELEKAKNKYAEAQENVSAMESFLYIKKNIKDKPAVLSQYMTSILNLKKKEKKHRDEVDKLNDLIIKRNTEALKLAVKKRSNNIEE